MAASLLTAHWPKLVVCALAHDVPGKHVDQMARVVNTMVSATTTLHFFTDAQPQGLCLLLKHNKCFPAFAPWHQLPSAQMLLCHISHG